MSYQLQYFPDPQTDEIIPDAIAKDTVIRIQNQQGVKYIEGEFGFFRSLEASKTKDTRVKLSLSQLLAMATGEDGVVPSLSQEAIDRIHASAVGQLYTEIAAVIPMFSNAKIV